MSTVIFNQTRFLYIYLRLWMRHLDRSGTPDVVGWAPFYYEKNTSLLLALRKIWQRLYIPDCLNRAYGICILIIKCRNYYVINIKYFVIKKKYLVKSVSETDFR